MEESDLKTIKEAVEELLQKMAIGVLDVRVVSLSAEDGNKETVNVDIHVGEPQILIGHSGQTLFELSRILRILLNKKLQKDFYLDLDINDYKKKKIDYLKDLANTTADQVVLTKEKKVLPPMPAYERRIIHAQLSQRQDVATESHGEDINRCVVIAPQ